MKKILVFSMFPMFFVSQVFGNAGVSVSTDPNFAHVFAYNHVQAPGQMWNTINDWVKIEDPNSANVWTLSSDTANVNDTITDWVAQPAHELRTDLQIDADAPLGQGNPYPVAGGMQAGYQWTVPAAYANEVIVKFKVAGFFNFAPQFSELRILDDNDAVIANIVQGFAGVNWINPAYTQEWLIPGGTKTIKIVLFWNATNNNWIGNYVWLFLPQMTTAVAAQCGDALHPFPVGDITSDCVVNLLDLAELSLHWLENTQPI